MILMRLLQWRSDCAAVASAAAAAPTSPRLGLEFFSQFPHHSSLPARTCSDNLRGFFEQCFPTLLKRLFGYDGPSWLNLVARVRHWRG